MKNGCRGLGGDDGHSVQQTSDHGYIIIGEKFGYGAWMIKTDSSGNKQWDKIFIGTVNNSGRSVRQTNDGGYVIIGSTSYYGAGGRDVWLIKTDSEGNVEEKEEKEEGISLWCWVIIAIIIVLILLVIIKIGKGKEKMPKKEIKEKLGEEKGGKRKRRKVKMEL